MAEEIGGWRVEHVIAEGGDVHELAVSQGGRHAVMHMVAPGRSSTLLHAATAQRALIVRGRHDGNAFVVTSDAAPKQRPRRSLVLPMAVIVLALVGGGLAVLTLVRDNKPACSDCVLIVDGTQISTASYRMYASDPYLFPDTKGEERKRAALDLLIVRAVLHAQAEKRGVTITDVAERARDGEFAIGLRTFDVRAKLAEDSETFTDTTVDRYAKAVGLADRAALFEEMRIERMAIEVGNSDHAAVCRSARVLVVTTFLAEPYRPCASL